VSTAINALTTDDIEEGVSNLYFTEERAQDAIGAAVANSTQTGITVTYDDTDGELNFSVADQWTGKTTDDLSEGVTNRYFTNQRALDATSAAYDVTGAAQTAYDNAVAYADGLAINYDPAGSASAAQTAAQSYADGLAVNYDAAGSATTAENNAKSYADSLAVNYDAAGAAATAESNANSYTDTAVANLVDGAPALLDTLNELAAAINDDASFASTITTSIGEKVAKSGDTMTGELVLAADPTQALAAATKQYVDAAATNAYNDAIAQADTTAQGYANTAENNAEAYADSLAANYEPAGAVTTAINALTTSDIEEGTNLYFTDQRAVDAVSNTSPIFASVDVTWVRKEEATWTMAASAGTYTAHTFAASKGSVKYLVRIVQNTGGVTVSQVSEVLVTTDSSNNIAVLEYGTIYTSESELASITADWDAANSQYRLRVTTASNSSEILVAATLLSYND
jgi:hypothetical protein